MLFRQLLCSFSAFCTLVSSFAPNTAGPIHMPGTGLMTSISASVLGNIKSNRKNTSLSVNTKVVSHVGLKERENSSGGAESGIFKIDPIVDWIHPSVLNITSYQKILDERVEPLEKLTSAVYFSTDKATGKVYRGLSRIPSPQSVECQNPIVQKMNRNMKRPLLFVGNHQLFGIDMWMMVPHVWEERKIALRGLAHPIVFDTKSADEDLQSKDMITQLSSLDPRNLTINSAVLNMYGLFRAFGALPASPQNLYKLLQTSQCVLHYPGGAREAYHSENEEYKLFWPGDESVGEEGVDRKSSSDFIRMAARFNATIVPISAIGGSDSGIIVGSGDAKEFKNAISTFRRTSPVLSNFLQSLLDSPLTPKGGKHPRPPPLMLPKVPPARHYFLFGKEYSTEHLDHRDRESCAEAYKEVHRRVERGIKVLLRARNKDPYCNSLKRLVYEQITRKKAPTVSVDIINELLQEM